MSVVFIASQTIVSLSCPVAEIRQPGGNLSTQTCIRAYVEKDIAFAVCTQYVIPNWGLSV